jgi:hypothetical protein
MNETAFYGLICSGDPETVRKLLGNWLGTDVALKIRLLGEEIVHEQNDFYLYAHTAFHTAGEQRNFLLEGHTKDGPEETKQRLEKLVQLCKAEGVKCECEYVQVDQDGNEISDQFQVT